MPASLEHGASLYENLLRLCAIADGETHMAVCLSVLLPHVSLYLQALPTVGESRGTPWKPL